MLVYFTLTTRNTQADVSKQPHITAMTIHLARPNRLAIWERERERFGSAVFILNSTQLVEGKVAFILTQDQLQYLLLPYGISMARFIIRGNYTKCRQIFLSGMLYVSK